MLMDRRPDGSLVFGTTWQDFILDWKLAKQADTVLLDDGRPAVVRRHPETGEVSYVTLHPRVWDVVRQKFQETLRLDPPKKRERLCRACRQSMTVSRETTDVWCFKCTRCDTTDIEAKALVGGTRGQGEEEKR